jgi:glycerol-3-phosphate responsive antiterminator
LDATQIFWYVNLYSSILNEVSILKNSGQLVLKRVLILDSSEFKYKKNAVQKFHVDNFKAYPNVTDTLIRLLNIEYDIHPYMKDVSIGKFLLTK